MTKPTTATFEVFAAGTHAKSEVPTLKFTTADLDGFIAFAE